MCQEKDLFHARNAHYNENASCNDSIAIPFNCREESLPHILHFRTAYIYVINVYTSCTM